MNSLNDWNLHYEALVQKGLQPSTTLQYVTGLQSLQKSTAHRLAIDLGCGSGIDTLYLLTQGWEVLAIDKEPSALERLNAGTTSDLLTTRCTTFEEMSIPPALLVNASFALPFCNPAHFPDVWSKIRAAIAGGGYFAGHFFGKNDSWSGRADMNFHSRIKLMHLLSGLQVLFFEETEKEGKTIGGVPKHWHVFHVVAKAPVS